MLNAPGNRTTRKPGQAWLSVFLSMVMTATLSVPSLAWAEAVQQSDARAELGDLGESEASGLSVESDDAADAPDPTADSSDFAETGQQLASEFSTRSITPSSTPVATVGPLHVFYALDGGVEQEMASSTQENATRLEALQLDPATFETLRLRIAPADGFSFDAGSGNRITSLSVGWQSTTADGITVASEIALQTQSDGSRTCSIPSALLRTMREAEYDYFAITWQTDAPYPNAFGVYHGIGLVADPEYPTFDFSSIVGTYRDASGKSIALSFDGAKRTGAILDEVDSQGNVASSSANQVVRSYDAQGNLLTTAVVVGSNVNAYLTIGTDSQGARTLTAQDDYAYRTLAGQGAGRIAKGTVFTSETVARIGANVYASLQAAFAAAQDGDVIELVDDFVVTGKAEGDYLAGKTIVFDLGGHALIGDNDNAVMRIKSGDVTIRNGTVRALEGTYSTIMVGGAKTTLENLVVENVTGNGMSVMAFPGGVLVVKDSVTSTSKLGGGVEATGGTVDIYGGTFTQTGFHDWNSTTVAASNGGTVTVHGGTFTSENYGLYVFNSGGTINVENGTFSAGEAVLKADRSDRGSAINVKGGSFSGALEPDVDTTFSLTGGAFNSDVRAYLSDGYFQHATTGEVLLLPASVGYRVEHYQQNATDDGYTLAEEETLSGAPYADTAATSKSYEGFALAAQGVQQQEILPEGTTVVKVYYDRRAYQVTWDANGGAFADGTTARATVRFGAPLKAPVATRIGHVLFGWDAEVPSTMPARDMTFKARWIEAVGPELPDVAVVAPEVGDDPEKPSATISDDAKRVAAQAAADALAAIKAGEVPAGMTQQEADAVRAAVGDDPADRVSTVVVVSAVPVETDEVAADAALIAGSLGEGQAALMHFDLKVSMVVTNHTTGARAECALTEVAEPLAFEIHVPPSSIAGKVVRIAFVHNGETGFLDPSLVDYELGVIAFSAAKYSTYAVVLSDAPVVADEVQVTFESNGGSPVPAQRVKVGGTVKKPADPVRAGYAFAGWFADEALTVAWDFAVDTVEAPLVLYAKWTLVPPTPTPAPPTSPEPSTLPTSEETARVPAAQPKALAATGDSLNGALGSAFALVGAGGLALALAARSSRRKR